MEVIKTVVGAPSKAGVDHGHPSKRLIKREQAIVWDSEEGTSERFSQVFKEVKDLGRRIDRGQKCLAGPPSPIQWVAAPIVPKQKPAQ